MLGIAGSPVEPRGHSVGLFHAQHHAACPQEPSHNMKGEHCSSLSVIFMTFGVIVPCFFLLKGILVTYLFSLSFLFPGGDLAEQHSANPAPQPGCCIAIRNQKNDRQIIKGRISFYKSEPLNSLFIDVAVICMSVGVHLSFAVLNGDLAL